MDATIRVNHPGMTKQFFDLAIQRAYDVGITAREVAPGQWSVESGTIRGLAYLVTERECPCPAGTRYGRCCHRARVIFEIWVRQQSESAGTKPAA